MEGGDGNDFLYVTNDNYGYMYGNSGDDFIYAYNNLNTVDGGTGNDSIEVETNTADRGKGLDADRWDIFDIL